MKQTRVEPTVHVTHPDFAYKRGSDVQATWRKFGWTPPSEGKPAPPPEKPLDKWDQPVWRVK